MPLEMGGAEGEPRNSLAHINPDPQLLGVLNPLLRCPLGLLSSVFCLINHFYFILFACCLSSRSIRLPRKSFMENPRTETLTLIQHRHLSAGNSDNAMLGTWPAESSCRPDGRQDPEVRIPQMPAQCFPTGSRDTAAGPPHLPHSFAGAEQSPGPVSPLLQCIPGP